LTKKLETGIIQDRKRQALSNGLNQLQQPETPEDFASRLTSVLSYCFDAGVEAHEETLRYAEEKEGTQRGNKARPA